MHFRTLPLILLPTLLHAQTRCVDSLAGASWRSTPLMATVTAPPPGQRDADRYLAGMLPRLAQSFRDPNAADIQSGVMGTIQPVDVRPEIAGTMSITLDRDGRVLGARMTASTGVARLDSGIVRAALRVGDGRGFGKAPRKLRGDTLTITLAVSDRAPAGPRTAPLGSYSTSYLVANVPPRIRQMPPARAPRGRRGREVTLAATVNSVGRVVPGSIRVVSTTDSTLVPIARRSLERSTYRPGTRNGCPAESYIRQRFPFQ